MADKAFPVRRPGDGRVMPNPQQPELRRSDKGSTVQDSAETRNTVKRADEGRPHGQDKGNKGGGRGGGVPPDQQPPHPS